MEFGFDEEHQIFVLKNRDGGKLLSFLQEHKIHAMYDYGSGEYLFHNRTDYHAAMLLI